MGNFSDLPSIKETIDQFDLRARKSLGQNFLMDPGITDRIAAIPRNMDGAHIIEIGPGPGGLTRSLLLTNASHITAIEFDDRAVNALQPLKSAAGDRLTILHTDALRINWSDIVRPDIRTKIVANLPYNISTVLLAGWLEQIARGQIILDELVLMFQKEVADRLQARPNTPDYGRLSVLAQWVCDVETAIVLPPGAFVPPPKIYSSVVRFTPKLHSRDTPKWETMDALLSQAFAHRRKMIRSNLKNYVPILEEMGIAPTLRAEDLTLDTYIALARRIEQEG